LGDVVRGQPLSVTAKEISYAGRTLTAGEITGLRWGIFVHYVNGIENRHDFTIEVASSMQEILVEWGKRSIFKSARQFIGKQPIGAPIADLSSDDQQQHFGTIVQAVFGNYAPGVVQRMVECLNSGGSYRFGSATLTSAGVRFRVGLIFKKDVQYPWNQIACGTAGGSAILTADVIGAPDVSCSLREVRNAVMLPYLTKVMGGRVA
jgi:hypothetical protein